ncbi:ferredoxin [Streptomyces sp. NPDC091371]|uniref:ferredoxin n=1 Tax=Streptomyces sp. NPDC091371 TaxID=3155303 RepID=UPI00341323A9
MTYWDPMATVRATTNWFEPSPEKWAQRNRLNVPGPFYGAETDNCLTGRNCAPDHVMYDDGDYLCQEFVFRQPRTVEETRAVLCAVGCEPWGGYGLDGDDHWTPELVRDWWRDRGEVRAWAVRTEQSWSAETDKYLREAAAGARAFVAHIDGDLADYLRGYLFWLQERRPAGPGESLPELGA